MSFKNIYLYIALGAIIILAACNGPSAQEKIYDHLEEAVQLEAGFEALQDEIVALEKQEQEIYSQIADLEADKFDEIKKLSEQAIESIEKRSDKVVLEKESIAASQAEFEKIKDIIEKLDEEAMKEKAEEMYNMMTERFQAYDTLHAAYLLSLKEETALYTLLQKEDLTQDELTEQIMLINDVYEQVIQGNEAFNTDTVAYNALKEEFYTVAKLEVTYKRD